VGGRRQGVGGRTWEVGSTIEASTALAKYDLPDLPDLLDHAGSEPGPYLTPPTDLDRAGIRAGAACGDRAPARRRARGECRARRGCRGQDGGGARQAANAPGAPSPSPSPSPTPTPTPSPSPSPNPNPNQWSEGPIRAADAEEECCLCMDSFTGEDEVRCDTRPLAGLNTCF
jgi:hypothetical protein